MPRPLVIQTEDLDPQPAAWLAERCELVRCPADDPRFPALLARAEGLIVRTYTRVDDAMLTGAPRLRVVGRAGVGVDNIDVAACSARGVIVVNMPGANTRAVVEFVAAAMLDSLRPRATLDRPLPPDEWNRLRKSLEAERELAGLTLGILGLGRIGSQVARLGAALDMRVLYHDLREIAPPDRHGAQPVPLDDLLAAADVLSVHVDARPSNRALLGPPAFARTKPDALLINTSRGFVVDAVACAAFLRANPRAAAVLDVFDPEPPGSSCPLWGLPNARLTPHVAGATRHAKREMSWVVRDVWRVLTGEAPEHTLTPDSPSC
ncbi:MAG: hypothetical protein KIS87_03145 [Phycisphaeraceae bacterium]|nr:hypothetical protein [Phycisphaeraceae bacterium]